MAWRYGLIRNEHGAAIHEVHMDDAGKRTGITAAPVTPVAFTDHGEDLQQSIIWQLERMLADVRKYGLED